jgi:hypothetical protein
MQIVGVGKPLNCQTVNGNEVKGREHTEDTQKNWKLLVKEWIVNGGNGQSLGFPPLMLISPPFKVWEKERMEKKKEFCGIR